VRVTEGGVTVECLKCGHIGFLNLKLLSRAAVAPGHAYSGIRQTSPVPSLRKSERACHSQGFTAKGFLIVVAASLWQHLAIGSKMRLCGSPRRGPKIYLFLSGVVAPERPDTVKVFRELR
jgi:hypothetical protein